MDTPPHFRFPAGASGQRTHRRPESKAPTHAAHTSFSLPGTEQMEMMDRNLNEQREHVPHPGRRSEQDSPEV